MNDISTMLNRCNLVLSKSELAYFTKLSAEYTTKEVKFGLGTVSVSKTPNKLFNNSGFCLRLDTVKYNYSITITDPNKLNFIVLPRNLVLKHIIV